MSQSPATREFSQWFDVLAEISRHVSKQQFHVWFRDLKAEKNGSQELVISAPSQFVRDWLEERYRSLLTDAMKTVTGQEWKIKFITSADGNGHDKARDVEARTPRDVVGTIDHFANTTTKPVSKGPSLVEGQLIDRYTFDTFVVGPCNQLAHAAALAVAENPARAYNPLFLYGDSGLGKTHLLHAICHQILKTNPNAKVLYISCEQFTNEFITAVRNHEIDPFRKKFRYVDVFLLDDIHFLTRAERTQEEFFHTFNSLHNAQKQIVLSADCAPKSLSTLEDRLVSRFEWGLVAQLEKPEYETRLLIVRQKAQIYGLSLPQEIVEFIAAHITSNVREIEGAILKITGYSRLVAKPITLEMTRDVLRDSVEQKKNVKLEDILRVVSEYYGIRITEMQSKKRSKSVAVPRQVCMYLARELTDLSYEEIGGFFGGRDHSTVMHSVQRIQRLLVDDTSLYQLVQNLKKQLGAE